MRRPIRPVAICFALMLTGSAQTGQAGQAGHVESRASGRPGAGASLHLPAEAKAAIRRIHDLHRAPPLAQLGPDETKLHQLERATRRMQVLLLDVAMKEEPAESEEALSTLRAEWARWQQLRRDAEAHRRADPGGPRERRRASIADERLDALARTIAREMAAAGVAATGASARERKSARDQLRARLEKRPSHLAERFPPSLLTVVISGEVAPEAELAEKEAVAPAPGEGLEPAVAEAAERRELMRWPELKKLFATDPSGAVPTAPGDHRPRPSFLSPAGPPRASGSTSRDHGAPREATDAAP